MNENQLKKHMSPLAALAFSIGTSIGWGSLVVTCNTYLAGAGPAGSVLGLIIGAVAMLIISRSYTYLMRMYPEAGGAYSYSKEVLGYDYGFLSAWFLAMTYLAILWANITSLPLFGRIFLGGLFKVGKLYTIFGYDVYFGEILLSIAATAVATLICANFKRAVDTVMVVLAGILILGIAVCFVSALSGGGSVGKPYFIEDTNAVKQIVEIAVISPWAFIGFENISHFTEEFTFDRRKLGRIFTVSVTITLALYIMITLMSVTAYPDRYSNWTEYIADIGNLSGIEALPPFYAAHYYMGDSGVYILMLVLLSLVITSLFGNISAIGRLFYSLSKDRVLPGKLDRIYDNGIPKRAVVLVGAVSLIIPFVGRTAIGWIVDVTTIGATIIYALTCASAVKLAKDSGDKNEARFGYIGLVLMAVFGSYLLIPDIVTRSTISKETFLLFIVWSVLGFAYFRYILKRDTEKRFGSSAIVWVALMSLVFFVAFVWMKQSMLATDDSTKAAVLEHYESIAEADSVEAAEVEAFIESQFAMRENITTNVVFITMIVFAFVLAVMLTNHTYMSKRSLESEMRANTDSMTGVRNKHAYFVREKEINETILAGTVRNFAIVVCDLNGLKKVNDTLGHKAGDEYIIASARMIGEIFQHSPIYRVGGDEFLVIVSGRDYSVRGELMRILHERSKDHITNGGAVVSGGISDYIPDIDFEVNNVFNRADKKMYEEKKLLKSLGAASRDDEAQTVPENTSVSSLPEGFIDESVILNVRRSILIVDDELINQQLLGNMIEDDYEVLYASDGEDALEKLVEHREDIALVMLDIMMPKMGGVELLGRLKEDPEFRIIPVIVLTSDQNSEVECLKLGAADFIPKPYPLPEVIKARINKCIELYEDRSIISSTQRDSLTNLFTTDYFQRYVKLFDQHYPDNPMDAVVVDINRFHMINERYGKAFGDMLLRRVGERVRQQARKLGGVTCRQSADVFCLYTPHSDDYTDVLERLSDKLCDGLELPDGMDTSVSDRIVRLRLGVYYNVDKSIDIERRFDRAKMAASNVRGDYINAIGRYDEDMHKEMMFRERLLEDFRAGLDNRDFTVYFQPKFDIRHKKPILSSAEALVRWIHPELGMISPGLFIPLLEEHGLILELDRFVWNETAEYIRKCKDDYGFSVPISVNVSRIDMLMPDLKGIFKEIMERFSLTADDIILEITESAYTGDSEQIISMAGELRGMDMGFRIEMDDFGTGYSSLGMLSNLPIDVLKLDMSFVRNAFGENRDMRMIELIIDIADYLNVPVIAEGVETEEQYLTLKAMGCDIVQGYYFSKPLPKEEFTPLLEERSHIKMPQLPEERRNHTSISKALTNDFERIYNIDTLSDCYLEFYSGPRGELQLKADGSSFYETGIGEITKHVADEDRERLLATLAKDNLVQWAGSSEVCEILYSKKIKNELQPYVMRTIHTRNRDENHVVIGISPQKTGGKVYS